MARKLNRTRTGVLNIITVHPYHINQTDAGLLASVSDNSWWRGTVVERRSLAGELSLSCARPAADG